MLSKAQMNNLYAETAPPLIAFLQKERAKIVAEIQRLRKREAKRGGGDPTIDTAPVVDPSADTEPVPEELLPADSAE